MIRKSRILISLVLIAMLCSLLPTIPAAAGTDTPAMDIHAAVRTLIAYGIVDNKPEAELRLGDPVTRAEFAKILGSAMREQKMADAAQAIPAFADTAGHWANGWISVARSKGLFLGRQDGNFYPEDHVTYAEVLTALLRLLRRSDEANRSWPWGAVSTAAGLGMIPGDMDVQGGLMSPASRGDVFRLTATAIGRVALPGTGLTLLQTVSDQTPPVLSLDGFPAQTGQHSITVSGNAGDAVSVAVQGKPASMLLDGSFTAQVDLDLGDNVVPVVAVDGAGNRAEAAVHIVYQQLARVAIDPPVIETSVGGLFSASVISYDDTGHGTPVGGASFSYDTAVIGRDAKTGQFKALQAGEYTLHATYDGQDATATVVVSGDPANVELTVDHPTLAAGSAATAVHIRILDAKGRLNTTGFLTVTLTASPESVATLDTKTIKTAGGKAVVYLAPGSTPGALGLQAKVQAGSNSLLSPVVPVSVEARRFAKVKLEAFPANLSPKAGQAISIVATAIDQVGMPIAVMEDMPVAIRSSDDSLRITTATATIRKGTATSDFTGQNGAAVSTGRIGVSTVGGAYGTTLVQPAIVTTRHAEAISRLDVKVLQPAAGADNLSAVLVAVSRVDELGAVVTWETAPVLLFTSSTQVSITPVSDSGGVATFAVRSIAPGRIILTAGIAGRPELNSDPTEVAFMKPVGAMAKAVIQADTRSVSPGDAVMLSIALQGGGGAPVPNPGPALVYQLADANGTLINTQVTIPTGATQSAPVRVSIPQTASGNITVTGAMVGGKALANLQVNITPNNHPPVTYIGNNLVAILPGGISRAVAGDQVRFLIKAYNGNNLASGSQAFALKVRLNGKEQTTLPDNLQVTLGDQPVTGLIGRTIDGQAEVWVKYTGAGTIELVPVPVRANTSALDQWGVTGSGDTTIGYRVSNEHVDYSAGPLDHLVVSVKPNLGDSLQGVLRGVSGPVATVRLMPSDSLGNPAGSGCVATLSRKDDSSQQLAIVSGDNALSSLTKAVGSDGSAEFSIKVMTDGETSSEWVPAVTCGTTVLTIPQNITLTTTLAKSSTPTIDSIHGDASVGAVFSATDKNLLIRIAQIPGMTAPVQVLVYDGSDFIAAGGPIYPGSADQAQRTVAIPTSVFGDIARTLSLRVRLNTGADVSNMSAAYSVFFNGGTQ